MEWDLTQEPEPDPSSKPDSLRLSYSESGVFFGKELYETSSRYIGLPEDKDGHIVVIGPTGSGKSSGIVGPSNITWRSPMVVTDIDGSHSSKYAELYDKGFVERPYIIFDPMNPDSLSFDPFELLEKDGNNNLSDNIREIVSAIISINENEIEKYWPEAEREIFSAALLYCYKAGLSFSEAVSLITSQKLSKLCKILDSSSDVAVKMMLGESSKLKPEQIASLDRGIRNKLAIFSSNPYISHALRGSRENAGCFSFEDLEDYTIFLKIPEEKLKLWAPMINLFCTQLFHYLMGRPNKYEKGETSTPILLLLDEFPQFGKIDNIAHSLATLRKRNVHFCLFIQSLSQLDRIYGTDDRRDIIDNCTYKVILGANDVETQKYLAEAVGKKKSFARSKSEHTDEYGDITGYSSQKSEMEEWIIPSYQFSRLDHVIVSCPYGVYELEKFKSYGHSDELYTSRERKRIHVTATLKTAENNETAVKVTARAKPTRNILFRRNEETVMISIEERTKRAQNKISYLEDKYKIEERAQKDEENRRNRRKFYIIGEIVAKYFPQVLSIDLGETIEETEHNFENFELIVSCLSCEQNIILEIAEKAGLPWNV